MHTVSSISSPFIHISNTRIVLEFSSIFPVYFAKFENWSTSVKSLLQAQEEVELMETFDDQR